MSQKIFLIGLPGTGKTTLGKTVAAQLQLPFFDLDYEIEKTSHQQIKDIFADQGEAAFRIIESKTLKNWCQSTSSGVLATGGGTPCFHGNMSTMNAVGVSVFLDTPIPILAKRLEKTDVHDRPLLRGKKTCEEMLHELMDKRRAFYNKAHIHLTGDAITAEKVVEHIRSFQTHQDRFEFE